MRGSESTPTGEQWLRDGRAVALPEVISSAFDAHLNRLPWLGSALDWSKMPPSSTFDLVGRQRHELSAWIAGTRIGAHSHMAVWYSRAAGGLVTPLAFAIANLDALYRHSPGIRFAFGIDLHEGQLRPAYADLLQYGNGDELVAVIA